MITFTTFSIVAGSPACNADCPFCISHMTVPLGLEQPGPPPAIDWRRFAKACRFARDQGVSTALITGKGEPTLYPEQVSAIIDGLARHDFPIVELQTNGIRFDWHRRQMEGYLPAWVDGGLTTVALSVVDWRPERNQAIYTRAHGRYIDLPGVIAWLHDQHLTVRLAVVMLRDGVDTIDSVTAMIEFARQHAVEQLSLRPVAAPSTSRDEATARWTLARLVPEAQQRAIEAWVAERGELVQTLPWGGQVYDLQGQNVCLTNCLTRDARAEVVTEQYRSLIFFPDGHVRTSWDLPGSIIF